MRQVRPSTRPAALPTALPTAPRAEPVGPVSGPARLEVAFAGEPGSFAEDAVLAAYPAAVAQPVPLFEDVVRAVAGTAVAAGVLPIENVVGGGVREVYDLLLDSEVAVVGEVIHRACLLAHPGPHPG
jgi:prephenate dehydratase